MDKQRGKEKIDKNKVINIHIDYCAWHKGNNGGAFHCSYCCPSCNPIFTYEEKSYYVQYS